MTERPEQEPTMPLPSTTEGEPPKWVTDIIASEIGDVLAEESCRELSGEDIRQRADACATYIVARINSDQSAPVVSSDEHAAASGGVEQDTTQNLVQGVPTDGRVAPECCLSNSAQYGCTLPRGHDGDHAAYGAGDTPYETWPAVETEAPAALESYPEWANRIQCIISGLRVFIRQHSEAGSHSLVDVCQCPLCDVNRLVGEFLRLRASLDSEPVEDDEDSVPPRAVLIAQIASLRARLTEAEQRLDTLAVAVKAKLKCVLCHGDGKPRCSGDYQSCPPSCACHEPTCFACKGDGLSDTGRQLLALVQP